LHAIKLQAASTIQANPSDFRHIIEFFPRFNSPHSASVLLILEWNSPHFVEVFHETPVHRSNIDQANFAFCSAPVVCGFPTQPPTAALSCKTLSPAFGPVCGFAVSRRKVP
jgi:hypothetical protein